MSPKLTIPTTSAPDSRIGLAENEAEAIDTNLASSEDIDLSSKKLPIPQDVQDRILKAAWELSFVQALNPKAKDDHGFNNADYKVGGIISMSGDITGSALMLIRYPAQYPAFGLELDDLRWAIPKRMEALPSRMGAGQALADIRDAARNKIAWAENGDSVFLVGNGLGSSDKNLLKGLGTATKTGYEIPKEHLDLLLKNLEADVINHDDLDAIAHAVPQRESFTLETGANLGKIVVTARPSGNGYAVSYSDYRSPDGILTKEAVKLVGGRFDGASSAWNMSKHSMEMLAVVLEDSPFANIAALPIKPEAVSPEARLEAEQLMDGITPIKVNGVTADGVKFATLARCDALFGACREAGVRWDGTQYVAKVEQLSKLLSLLDGQDSLDSSKLASAALEFVGQLVAREERIAKVVHHVPSDVPDTTPTGGVYKPFQKEGVKFFQTCGPATNTKGGLMADDMGLGKTLQAIMGAHSRLPDGKKLIMCPASLKGNWMNEIGKWLGPEEAAQAQVVKDGKTEIDMSKKWLIINYDLVAKHKAALMAFAPDMVIFDEAQELKNRKSQRGVAVFGQKKLDKLTNKWTTTPGIIDDIPLRFPCTGTPIMNRTAELYSQLLLIDHPLTHAHSKHPLRDQYPYEKSAFIKFGMHFCAGHKEQIDSYGTEVWNFKGSSNLKQLGELMKPCYIKRLKKDVLQLGEKVQIPFTVELSPAQRKEYNLHLKELLADHRGDSDSLDLDLPKDNKNRGEALRTLGAMKHAAALAKVDATFERIKSAVEGNEKVVVFSLYLDVLDKLEGMVKDYLAEREQKYLRLDGGVASGKRFPMQEQFQNDPDTMVWLGQAKASGVGLTLTAATVCVHNDVWWNPAMVDQATDRIYRIGQDSPVMIYYMQAEDTFDDDLYAIVMGKRENNEAFEDAAENTEATDVSFEGGKAAESVMGLIYKKLIKDARKLEKAEKPKKEKKAKKP